MFDSSRPICKCDDIARVAFKNQHAKVCVCAVWAIFLRRPSIHKHSVVRIFSTCNRFINNFCHAFAPRNQGTERV